MCLERCVMLTNVTCIRFQKCTTLATGSVAMEHPGPKRATKVRCSLRCSIKALIAYASEHYEGSSKKWIERDKNIHSAHKLFFFQTLRLHNLIESKMTDRRIHCAPTKDQLPLCGSKYNQSLQMY